MGKGRGEERVLGVCGKYGEIMKSIILYAIKKKSQSSVTKMQFRLGRRLSGKVPACEHEELSPLKARCGRTHLSSQDSCGEVGGPALQTCKTVNLVCAVGDSMRLQLKQVHGVCHTQMHAHTHVHNIC